MKKKKTKGTATHIDALVGKNLRAVRELTNCSQEKLANAIGITFQQIQKYESGKNRISASRLFDIANFFGVTPNFFFPKDLYTWSADKQKGRVWEKAADVDGMASKATDVQGRLSGALFVCYKTVLGQVIVDDYKILHYVFMNKIEVAV